mgnify:CR=1 FL=1
MTDDLKAVAAQCLAAAHDGSLDFPHIVQKLTAAGFESYAIDFRRRTATYYLPDGDSVELTFAGDRVPVAPSFAIDGIKAAIREAQAGGGGYTYAGFCEKVKAAGCAGYIVSFSGRRALYFGRTAETHVEHFPS